MVSDETISEPAHGPEITWSGAGGMKVHEHHWRRFERVFDLDTGRVALSRYFCEGCAELLEVKGC